MENDVMSAVPQFESTEDGTCFGCGHPETDCHCPPDQCGLCSEYNTTGEIWPTVTIDDDPGDPEVGPDPHIIDVSVCPACQAKQ